MTVINPRASISPYSLNFGTVEVGHSSTQKVTVTNTGTTALDISKAGVTGADAGNFKPTNLCPSSLAASDSCTIEVTFTPSTTGSRSATLTVTDNAKTSPQSAPLSGKGSYVQMRIYDLKATVTKNCVAGSVDSRWRARFRAVGPVALAPASRFGRRRPARTSSGDFNSSASRAKPPTPRQRVPGRAGPPG